MKSNKLVKFDCVQLKKNCIEMIIIESMKKQPTEWKKLLGNISKCNT